MPAVYIARSLEPVLNRAAEQFPVVVLTGPRQSGKTTLLKQRFGRQYRYVSLDPPDVRAAAATDPRGFLDLYPPPVIFDEVQYAPDLLCGASGQRPPALGQRRDGRSVRAVVSDCPTDS